MLNSVNIMGRLIRDPELRQTQSGIAVASFSLAVERDFKPQDGEREVDFFDFIAWRSTAEFVKKYLSKGRMAVVDGKLQSRKWQDKNGNNRVSVEVVADSVYFGDSKKDGDGSGAPQAQSPGQYSSGTNNSAFGAESEFTDLDMDDSELPL